MIGDENLQNYTKRLENSGDVVSFMTSTYDTIRKCRLGVHEAHDKNLDSVVMKMQKTLQQVVLPVFAQAQKRGATETANKQFLDIKWWVVFQSLFNAEMQKNKLIKFEFLISP